MNLKAFHKKTFARYFTLLVLALMSASNVWGEITPLTLPKTWDSNDGKSAYTEALGCTIYNLGDDYSSAPKLKFDTQGDYMIIQLADAPDEISFNIKGNSVSGTYSFKVQESVDGKSYSDALNITSVTSSSSTESVSLNSNSRYIKLIYATKAKGNMGLGGISITKGSSTPSKTLTSIAISGTPTKMTYDAGEEFNPAGLTVTGTYNDESTDDLTSNAEWTFDPATLSVETTSVKVTATVDGKTATETITGLTVNALEGDKLTPTVVGNPSSYGQWEKAYVGTYASYIGYSMGGSDKFQLKSSDNVSGIVSTTSGGNIAKVKVTWNSSTINGRVLDIYGSKTAYKSASDLYDNAKKGTKIGSIEYGKSTEFIVSEGEYTFVGIRSASGALYLNSITFVWEEPKTLESIAVKTAPTKTQYFVGDEFDPTGLVITATYDDESTEEIAYSGNESKFSFSPALDAALTTENTSVTISYGGKSAEYTINVQAVTLQSLTISGKPTKTAYYEGESFNPDGLVVTGHYNNNTQSAITEGITWSVTPSPLTVETTSVSVKATVGDVTSDAYAVDDLTVISAASTYTLTAQPAEGGSYTVTVGSDPAEDVTTDTKTFQVQEGTVIQVEAKAAEGYQVNSTPFKGNYEGDPQENINFEANGTNKKKFTYGTANATIYAQFRKLYAVKIDENIEHGKVEADPTEATGSSKITLTITPDAHYQFESVTVTDKNGSAITLSELFTYESGITTATFSMPNAEATKGDVSVTATFTEDAKYKVTFSVNGVETPSEANYAGEAVVFPEVTNIPEGYVFRGWTDSPIDGTAESEPTLISSALYPENDDAIFYAVFAKQEGEESWKNITNLTDITEGTYVLVSEQTANEYRYMPNTAATNSNPSLGTGISIANNALTNVVTDVMQWALISTGTDNEFYIRPLGDQTLGLGTTNSTGDNIRISSSYKDTKWTINTNEKANWQINNNNTNPMYLAVYSDTDWRNYKNNTTNQNGKFYFFKKTGVISYSDYCTIVKALKSIEVKTAPTKTAYNVGDNFAPTGLVITAKYNTGDEDVTYDDDTKDVFTFSPALDVALTTANTNVTITYECKSVVQNITVSKIATSLSWSAVSCEATIDEENVYPTLTTTPTDLQGVTYSSSNPEFATIDESTGAITLVAEGETTIKASFAETDKYFAATDVTYILTVKPSTDTRAFVNITEVSAESNTIIKGETAQLTISNDQDGWTSPSYKYESSDEDVATVEDGVVTAVGKGTATITVSVNIASDDANYRPGDTPSKSIEITVNNPSHTAKFSVNGAIDDSQNITAEEGEAITFPTEVSAPDDEHTFCGWVSEQITEPLQTAPDYVNVDEATIGKEDVIYYAVFAEKGGSEPAEQKTQTLEYDTWKYSGSTTDKNKDSYRLFHSGSYIESAEFDLSKLNKVIVYGGSFGGSSYNSLTIGDGTNTWKSVTVSGSSQTGKNEYSSTDATPLSGMGKLRITSNSGSASGNGTGVRISKVEIYTMEGGYTYSNYTTSVLVKELTGIVLGGEYQTEFWKGDAFSHEGMTVTAHYSNAPDADVTAKASFSTPDMNTASKQTVTVTYDTKSTTYYINVKSIANIQETAYSVSEAKAIIDANPSELNTVEVYVKGTVSQVDSYNETYKSITYWISEDGTTTDQFEVYSGKRIEGADFDSKADISVGDDVVIKGKIQKFNSTYEFNSGNYLVSRILASSLSIENMTVTVGNEITPKITTNVEGEYTITYESNNTGAVNVDNNGKLVTVAEGKATITATLKAGGYKDATTTFTIDVITTKLSRIEIEGTLTKTEYNIGDNVNVSEDFSNLKAYAIFTNASASEDEEEPEVSRKDVTDQVTWSVNPSVFTKDHVGEKNPIYITATYNGVDGTETFTVKVNRKTSTIIIADLTLKQGSNVTISAETTPSEAALTYEITENKDNCISLSDRTITASTTPGTATVKASFAGNEEYKESSTSFNVTVLPRYKITWMANGAEFATTQVDEGDNLVLPKDNPVNIGDYEFVGWSTQENYRNDDTAPSYITAETVPTENTTYYAVYAKKTASQGQFTWNLVTDASTLKAGDVLRLAAVVDKSTDSNNGTFALGAYNTKYFNSVAATINNNQLVADNANDITLGGTEGSWTLTTSEGQITANGDLSIKGEQGNVTTCTISIDENNLATITFGDKGRILYNASSPRFKNYTTALSTAMVLPYIFRKTQSYTYSNYTTSQLEEMDINITAAGWATVCLPFDATYDKSVATAYYVQSAQKPNSGGEDESGTITKTPVSVINAGEGFILKSNNGGATTVKFTSATDTPDNSEGNLMVGNATAGKVTFNDETNYIYVLSKKSGNIGFYWDVVGGHSAACAAYKAVLKLTPEQAQVKTFFSFDEIEDVADGINNVNVNDNVNLNDNHDFNLIGQPVGSGYKGIVIINGKKVLRK